MSPDLQRLIRTLGHPFAERALLVSALTHCSVGSDNNERLEFLGDGALNFVVADELYRRFPDAPEGVLSRLRASLVKRDTLAAIGRTLALGDYLRLGSGELKSGGYRRESILADAVEAILGAVYLDAGFDACRALVLRLYEGRFDGLDVEGELKDPKTRLQELLQARRLPLPTYEVTGIEGNAHDQRFTVLCRVEGLAAPTEGQGGGRRRAEQEAARKALKLLAG